MEKYSYEVCKKAAALCKTRTEFNKRFPKESETSRKNGWHDEICSHMPAPQHVYTKEECQATALLYTNRGDFRKYSKKIYDKACHAGWIDEICKHMPGKVKKKAGWWDDIEHCKETARLYKTTKELIASEKGCHASIVKHKWTKICCSHMDNRHNTYADEDLAKIAQNYNIFSDFREQEANAYSVARKRGILNMICEHMTVKRRIKLSGISNTISTYKEITKSKDLKIKIEADRNVEYLPVKNLMRCLQDAGYTQYNLTTKP